MGFNSVTTIMVSKESNILLQICSSIDDLLIVMIMLHHRLHLHRFHLWHQ